MAKSDAKSRFRNLKLIRHGSFLCCFSIITTIAAINTGDTSAY